MNFYVPDVLKVFFLNYKVTLKYFFKYRLKQLTAYTW